LPRTAQALFELHALSTLRATDCVYYHAILDKARSGANSNACFNRDVCL